MPRMSKGRGEELSFFRSPEGRIKINLQCRTYNQFCKQSYRATILCCPIYDPKYEYSERMIEDDIVRCGYG